MNMMMMITKGRKVWLFGAGLVLLSVLILLLYFRYGEMGSSGGRQPELQTIQLRNGWGYQIVMNRKVLIYQPTIPSIDTLMAFPSETSARQIGSLVLDRIKMNHNFSITRHDIEKTLLLGTQE